MPKFKEVEVRVFREHAYCDECIGGELLPTTAGALLSAPTLHPHKCNACGVHVALQDRFPRLITRTVQ